MLDDDQEFIGVPIGSFKENSCSPKEPNLSFLGILIRAPRQVFVRRTAKNDILERTLPSDFAVVPICGLYMLPGPIFQKYGEIASAMRIIALNRVQGTIYTGFVAEPIPEEPESEMSQLTPEQLANTVSGGYFNPNLTERVPLPAISADYEVHVELGEKGARDFIESNYVKVNIVVDPVKPRS
jgi:hypothetical protein